MKTDLLCVDEQQDGSCDLHDEHNTHNQCISGQHASRFRTRAATTKKGYHKSDKSYDDDQHCFCIRCFHDLVHVFGLNQYISSQADE